MKVYTKKTLALVLALLFTVALLPTFAFAAEDDPLPVEDTVSDVLPTDAEPAEDAEAIDAEVEDEVDADADTDAEVENDTDALPEVVVSSQGLVVNGEVVEVFAAYNIGGGNYFKLRDIAFMLKNVFNITIDDEGRIILEYGVEYAANGTESTEKPAEFNPEMWDGASNDKFYFSTSFIPGEVVDFEFVSAYEGLAPVYKIGGSNYIQIKGLAEVFGIAVVYDAETNSIMINTNPAEAPEDLEGEAAEGDEGDAAPEEAGDAETGADEAAE